MEEKRRIPPGEDIDFEVLKEDWNEYKLADGTTLNLKLILTKVIKTNEYDPAGAPIYVCGSTNVAKTKVPPELKKVEPQEEGES